MADPVFKAFLGALAVGAGLVVGCSSSTTSNGSEQPSGGGSNAGGPSDETAGAGAGGKATGSSGSSAAGSAGAPAGAGGNAGSAPCVAEDPLHCFCKDGKLTAKDRDKDGHGTRECLDAPGDDCADGDKTFVSNVCGGCASLTSAPGTPCGECGVLKCEGGILQCRAPDPTPKRCSPSDTNKPQFCKDGVWTNEAQTCATGSPSAPVCLSGNCVVCTPGTKTCSSHYSLTCTAQGSWPDSTTAGWTSCSLGCNAGTGACTSQLLHFRDRNYELRWRPDLRVVPLPLRHGHLPTGDVLALAAGSEFA
jgi:hypothetical protein